MFSRVWVLLVLLLPLAAARAQETSMVPVVVDGQTVRLEMRIHKPARAGPVPTLVLCGSEDRITPPALSEELAELIPGAQLELIHASGHLANAEQPQAFNSAIESFLSQQR